MRKVYLLTILLATAVFAVAQTAPTAASTFAVGSGNASDNNGSFAIVGQTFSEYAEGNGANATLGLAQTQVEYHKINAVINEGDEYHEYGFDYPSTTTQGVYRDTNMTAHGAAHNYDLVNLLRLVVEGPFECGTSVVLDLNNDEIVYHTVGVAGYCWTLENLRATQYAEGSQIPVARKYANILHPDGDANEETYGRLYSWYSAVNVPEGSNVAPVMVDNYVQGICPDGWHIPTEAEINALRAQSAETIRSTELWVEPNNNNNMTGFTSLPAGMYNSNTNQFHGLLTSTDYWSVTNQDGQANALELQYYCDTPLLLTHSKEDGLSVRCVKN
jgi:uncharacterized protein (TIGR02145 family)